MHGLPRLYLPASALIGLLIGCLLLSRSGARAAPATDVLARWHGTVVRRPRGFPERLIALTFDDGPNDRTTPRILAALAAHHAHATFFVLGSQARRYPDLLRRIAAEGHAIGNHSWSHPARPSEAQAVHELDDTAQTIRKITGHAPVLFRPPYGITRNALTRLALRRGYAVVIWDISSADTRPIGPAMIASNIVHTPDPGDIALMHDGAGHHATADAVPAILDELARAGYRFVTVPELLAAWDRFERAPPHRASRPHSAPRPHSASRPHTRRR